MATLQFSKNATVIGKTKSLTEGISASTTLQNDDDFSLLIDAGDIWAIEYHLSATFAAAAQIKVAITTPTGAAQQIDATMTSNTIAPAFGSTASSGEEIPLVCALATAGKIVITVLVTNDTTPGFVNLQWAQNTSNATATTVLVNSYMIATKLS